MLVIKSARWGATCANGLRSRIQRLASSQRVSSTTNTTQKFEGPYLPKDPTINKNMFREIKKNMNEPTTTPGEEGDTDVLGTPEARVMKRHLFLLKKYQNESSMRLVLEGLKDLPLSTERNAALLEDFLWCVRRIETTNNVDSIFTLTDVYTFIVERGIGAGSRVSTTKFLAETLIERLPVHSEMREYNRNISRFLESLQCQSPELVTHCIQKALPALKVHQASILMTEQLRIMAVATYFPDLDTQSQEYFFRVVKNLEGCCELFDFTELQLVLECIDNLDNRSKTWKVYQDMRNTLLNMVASLERRFTREILGPLHNPVSYSRSLALVSQLGATDVKMQLLKDKFENLILPRYSMARFIEESNYRLSNPSRAQRNWLLHMIYRDVNLHRYDADSQYQSRGRDNKRKTETDVKAFCNSLLRDEGIDYLVCPLKIMQLAKWKAYNLGTPTLLTEAQVHNLEQVVSFNLKCFPAELDSASVPQQQAKWLKQQLAEWKSATVQTETSPEGGKLPKYLSSQVAGQQKPLLNLSALASLCFQTQQPQ